MLLPKLVQNEKNVQFQYLKVFRFILIRFWFNSSISLEEPESGVHNYNGIYLSTPGQA